MFRRFERIRSCGHFDDFRWDSAVPDLGRINVFYGRNGAGKTSLARALDGLRNAEDGLGHTRVSVAVEDATAEHTTGFADDAIFDRVHVFGENYVSRSHRFTPAEADMDAVLTIGKRPVDAEIRLEELRELLRTSTGERDAATSACTSAQQALERAYVKVSQDVVAAASRAGGRWHSRSNFNAGMVRSAFNGSHDSWVELSEEELGEKIGIINSEKAELLPESPLVVLSPDDLESRLSAALASTPTTMILDTLEAHPEAASWVDDGRHFHRETDTCIFCGSGLSPERRDRIDQHFSDEVEKLQVSLVGIVSELATLEERIDRVVIPDKGLFAEDLRSRYDRAAEQLRSELKALKDWSVAARARAEAKSQNVLVVVNADVQSPPAVSGSELLALRTEHNARVESHASLVLEAAKSVELHYLKVAEASVQSAAELVAEKRSESDAAAQQIAEHNAEITTLESVHGDPMPSAKVLTDEVGRLLGRNELSFQAVDGRYRVLRYGEPAVGLSAGERTAITLVHFLECVARFDSSQGKPIVVIDDPVSSLDSDILVGVSTYIWTESVVKDHIAQVLLLTHNFELFRQWDIQIEGLHKGGKDKTTGIKLKDLYSASFYEMKAGHANVSGQMKRVPHFSSWPPSESARKKIRSTYHHAFISTVGALQALDADDSLENRLDAQLLFPNVIRRMLETFLAFKRPEWVGDFNAAMRHSAELLKESGYRGDANALRLRLTRYAHTHSHDEDPSTDTIVSPDEVATAIRSVFEFMNQIDEGHFLGLCRILETDPVELLPPLPPELVDDELPEEASVT